MTTGTMQLLYILIILAFSIVVIWLLGLWGRSQRRTLETVRRRARTGKDLMFDETDLRLTYKRFMELYPYSGITYAEYKKMQAERAYKKATSSTKIKRMVR